MLKCFYATYKEALEILNDIKESVPYHKEERFETLDEIREFFKSKGKEELYFEVQSCFETTGYHTTFEPHRDFDQCFLDAEEITLSPLKKSELTQNVVDLIEKFPSDSGFKFELLYNVGIEPTLYCKLYIFNFLRFSTTTLLFVGLLYVLYGVV